MIFSDIRLVPMSKQACDDGVLYQLVWLELDWRKSWHEPFWDAFWVGQYLLWWILSWPVAEVLSSWGWSCLRWRYLSWWPVPGRCKSHTCPGLDPWLGWTRWCAPSHLPASREAAAPEDSPGQPRHLKAKTTMSNWRGGRARADRRTYRAHRRRYKRGSRDLTWAGDPWEESSDLTPGVRAHKQPGCPPIVPQIRGIEQAVISYVNWLILRLWNSGSERAPPLLKPNLGTWARCGCFTTKPQLVTGSARRRGILSLK